MDLPFTDAVSLGRGALVNDELESLRKWFSMSHTSLAGHLHTNSRTLKRWLSDPAFAANIHDTTAARIGQLCFELELMARNLLDNLNIRISDLYPLSLLAGELGRSVTSASFAELCRTNAITCHTIGFLGVYIPKHQVEALKGKK